MEFWVQKNILKVLFLQFSSKKNSKKFISQGTIPHLISSNVLKIELKFTPDVAEQQKISQLFETFDSLILAYEQKVEYLKNLKNSFIAKMFI
ncbi:restriction endonuclease subunit S [Mesomycoplasma ovipneumoniae]